MSNTTTPLATIFLSENDFKTLLIDCVNTCLHHYTPPQVQHEEPDLISIKEASQLTNWSISTIYSKSSRGQLSSHKVHGSNRILFSRKNLMEVLSGERRPTHTEIEAKAMLSLTDKKPR